MPELFYFPGAAPLIYDQITANGVGSPGIARVSSDIAREYSWDRKQAPGAAGENITFRGLKLVSFTIECQLWTDALISEWETWCALWEWDPIKKKATPVEVFHPLLAERDVTIATATKIYAPKQSRPGDNLWIGKIEALEWKPPPRQNTTSSPKSTKPQTANEREISALLDEAKKLGG
jgi:hypothetical protein